MLHAFTHGADGSNLVLDANGNLYGTASGGGSTANPNCYPDGCGTVWELTPSMGIFTVLHTFEGYCSSPVSALILDSAGNLYGTTERGGTYGVHSPGGFSSCHSRTGSGLIRCFTLSILHPEIAPQQA